MSRSLQKIIIHHSSFIIYQFKGSFIADSAYTFLLIGNFFSFDSILHLCIGNSAYAAYYYIDNVCLSSTENNCYSNQTTNCEESFVVYPNPNSGIVNILTNCLKEKGGDIIVYDAIGQIVYSTILDAENKLIDLSFLAKGIYFLRVHNSILKIILI